MVVKRPKDFSQMSSDKYIYIIAEIGINHNGSLDTAKELIDEACDIGCDAVKFQKRTINIVYSQDTLNQPRKSPWGNTQREQKEGLEFSIDQYDEINAYCNSKNIDWFASSWDNESQKLKHVQRLQLSVLQVGLYPQSHPKFLQHLSQL